MYHKILVAFDGSDGSTRAFAAALDLAVHNGHELCLVSVIEDLPRYAEESISDIDEAMDHARKHFEVLLDGAEQEATAKGVRVIQYVLAGHAVETIVELAERENADLIVIGGLGHSRILRRASGGTGSQITYHAPCSVLVVR
jgi:nucleotide-binding universal stress UspA family protein